ncbi:SRPBCC family protein [Paenibacillus antri]|uniref:SRPBCC family protein n=1 Tax=Paenibacillus antri TaxID=2582848 RepID=A0A5R9G1J7_9BACL|nr:SRPBCC family protein [Paenibacillus antri]TLS49671.1 SRPBCC family protein [Paenibacillus antri]
MIQWKEEIVIDAGIETVWALFAVENMHRIMPNIAENRWKERKEGVVGSTFLQTYREGKRSETYEVSVLDYKDAPEEKRMRLAFVLAKAFEVEFMFRLSRISEDRTRFAYEGSNRGVNFVGRAMMKLGGESNNRKVVADFLEKVEREATGK